MLSLVVAPPLPQASAWSRSHSLAARRHPGKVQVFVPGDDVVGEVGGWSVGAAGVVEELAGVVGDQPSPGSGVV